MTDQQPINGAEPFNAIEAANVRFSKAYVRSIAPDGRFPFNPLQILCELEILKINLGVLVEMACKHGMDAAEFDSAALAALNSRAEALEGGPKLAVAPASVLRKR